VTKATGKHTWHPVCLSRPKQKGQFDLAINKSVRVMELFSFYDDVGFTVLIQEKKGKGEPDEHPLRDLIPTDDHLRMVVELYNLWFLEIFEEDPLLLGARSHSGYLLYHHRLSPDKDPKPGAQVVQFADLLCL
jgi:hypothetical protein